MANINRKFEKGKRRGFVEQTAPGVSTWTNIDDKRIPQNSIIWLAINDTGCLTAGWFVYSDGKWFEDYFSVSDKPNEKLRREVLEIAIEQLLKALRN